MIRTLLLTLSIAAVAAPAAPPPDIDQWVARAMRTFEVPGLALAIVKDDEVVLAKGYGVRKLGESTAVDARTLFGIASNTKAFTATALGLLVEEGKLEWDAPVIRYLPAFAMWDPFVTREITVRDLLVHRSGLGLGAGDLLWWPESTYDRKEIARRLRFIQPATSFRTAYAYDNVLYLIAGELIETISGRSWEDFVATRILAKVGMTGSNVRHSAAAAGGNVATPHAPVDGRVRAIRPFDSDNTNPAGGINSSAEDMAKWLRVQLSGGKLADGMFGYALSTIEGNGYKNPTRSKTLDWEGRVNVTPIKGLTAALGFYNGKLGKDVEGTPTPALHTAQRWDALLAYATDQFRVGAEYFKADNWTAVILVPKDSADGYSVWGSVNFTPKVSGFARYDSAKPNKNTVPDRKDQYFNLGVSCKPRKGVELAVVYKHDEVKAGGVKSSEFDEFGVWSQISF